MSNTNKTFDFLLLELKELTSCLCSAVIVQLDAVKSAWFWPVPALISSSSSNSSLGHFDFFGVMIPGAGLQLRPAHHTTARRQNGPVIAR